MTKKIIWRLASLPTASELQTLVIQDIISKEEAREILFKHEYYHVCDKCGTEWLGNIKNCPTCQEKRDVKSLESEIEFLRKLVEKLGAASQTKIVETIKYIEKPYFQYQWYQPYNAWCNGTTTLLGGVGSFTTTASSNNAFYCASGTPGTSTSISETGTSTSGFSQVQPSGFSKIKTF